MFCVWWVLFARSKQYKTLEKLAIIPSIFNINEPVILCPPIILNSLRLIPFVVLTLVALIVSYFAMTSGLAPLINGANLPWTIPPIISGFLLSGWKGATVQIVTTLMTTGIWYSLFTISNNKAFELEK